MIRRLFSTRIDDPCKSIDDASKILLYTLIVSHGIRVDTTLLIRSRDSLYVIYGSRLRHLYPREESIKGFAKAVFCERRRLPGVTIIDLRYLSAIKVIDCPRLAVITPIKGRPRSDVLRDFVREVIYHIGTRCILFHLGGGDVGEFLNHIRYDTVKYMDVPIGPYGTSILHKIYAATVLHHMLDNLVGSWVRRKGEVRYVAGEAEL